MQLVETIIWSNNNHIFTLKEFGEPAVLLENPKSMFYSLVEQTGPIVASQLTDMAKQVSFSFNSINLNSF